MTNVLRDFSVCPVCGRGAVEFARGRHWVCAACGFDLYHNVAAAVAVIVRGADGRTLFIRRAKEPGKGLLSLPGGFVDPGESAEAAAVRECREETALDAEDVRYAASFPNVYYYKNVRYDTCDMFFTARVRAASPRAADGEAAAFAFLPASTREEIAALPLAFPSHRQALEACLACTAPPARFPGA